MNFTCFCMAARINHLALGPWKKCYSINTPLRLQETCEVYSPLPELYAREPSQWTVEFVPPPIRSDNVHIASHPCNTPPENSVPYIVISPTEGPALIIHAPKQTLLAYVCTNT